MKYLIMIIFLLIPSFAFSHMSTTELETDCHGIDWVGVKPGIAWKLDKSNGAFSWDVSWMDDQTTYYSANWCCTGRGTCDHNIVRDPLFRCVNPPDLLQFEWRYGDHSYYKINGKPVALKADISIIENEKNYHLYRQNYVYYLNIDYIDTKESSREDVSVFIDKYNYIENSYAFFKNWITDFTYSEYLAAIGSDKYFIRANNPYVSGCKLAYYIETFFIVPQCVNQESWKLKLCRRESDGSLWCTDLLTNDTTIWKFYGRPSFVQASSVFIKDLNSGQLAKSDFIQDEIIYESNGETYQGFAYWYVVANYQGNAYVFKMYGSNPPCRNAGVDGSGVLGFGHGSKRFGHGGVSFGGGGIEEKRR